MKVVRAILANPKAAMAVVGLIVAVAGAVGLKLDGDLVQALVQAVASALL